MRKLLYLAGLIPAFLLLATACENPPVIEDDPEDPPAVFVRAADQPGFITQPPEGPYYTSPYELEIPELDFQPEDPTRYPEVQIIEPEKFSSWEEAGLNDPDKRYYFITPGNYLDLGKIWLSTSGTFEHRRVIRYYDPAAPDPYDMEHPAQLAETEKEVVLEAIELGDFFARTGTSHWVFHGITIRGHAGKEGGGLPNRILFGSNYNIFNFCLVEKVSIKSAIMIFQSNFNTIQNCVVREKLRTHGSDSGGISISAHYKKEARGNRIVSCEIYNLTDCIGLVSGGRKENRPEELWVVGEVPGTIIADNSLYIKKDVYVYKDGQEWACAEDGIDIKIGTKSTKPEDKILILNNKLWGYRPTDTICGGSGSNGSGIVIHREASNIFIYGNVFMDMAVGITIFYGNPRFPEEKVENITIANNLIYNLKTITSGRHQSGHAFKVTAPGTEIFLNTVIYGRKILESKPGVEPMLHCNTFIQVEDNDLSLANAQLNVISESTMSSNLADYRFWVTPWTGSMQVVIPKAIPNNEHPGYLVPVTDNCNCTDKIACL